jgi:iron complex outermembrane receptor protein
MRHATLHRPLLTLAIAAALPALAHAEDSPMPTPSHCLRRCRAHRGRPDQVMVTAQKRATNLQETPISVSVVDAEALKDRSAISLGSLSDGSIPSLRVTPFATRSSALNIGIRGIGRLRRRQPAGPRCRRRHLRRWRVHGPRAGPGQHALRRGAHRSAEGPQGTLFGRNTEGGAVSIVTKAPTGEFGGSVSAGVSNFSGYNSALHLTCPRWAMSASRSTPCRPSVAAPPTTRCAASVTSTATTSAALA